MKERLIDAWRRYGAWGFLQNLWRKGWSVLGLRIERMHLWAHDLTESSQEPISPYRELSYADFEAHRDEDLTWFTPTKMAKLARYYRVPGSRVYGCFVEGRLAAYGWISEQYLGCSKRRLEEGDGYLWDDYTHPDFRGRGWHLQLIKIREAELLRVGKRRALSVVANFNRASRRGYQRAGCTLYERYSFGRRWGKPFLMIRYGGSLKNN